MTSDGSRAVWQQKLELLSASTSALPLNIRWAEIGFLRTEVNEPLENLVSMFIIIDRAWRKPFTVKSDFAREGALQVAIAASQGFITTNIDDETWGKHWLVTPYGQEIHDEIKHILKDILQPPDVTN